LSDAKFHKGDRHYALATRESHERFVCLADRSKTLTWPNEAD
jgi:hypothetical protein